MDKLFIMIIVLMVFFLLAILFFVYFTSIGVEKDVNDLRTELEKAQAPRFSPMSIVISFMKFLLSLFPRH